MDYSSVIALEMVPTILKVDHVLLIVSAMILVDLQLVLMMMSLMNTHALEEISCWTDPIEAIELRVEMIVCLMMMFLVMMMIMMIMIFMVRLVSFELEPDRIIYAL